MNILQIWIGKKPDKNIIDSMKSVLNNLSENDKYYLISNTNFLNDNRVNLINYNEYSNLIKLEYDFLNKIPKSKEYHWCRSDLIRLDYLSKNSDTLYLDCDVTILEPLYQLNNKIYLPKRKKLFDVFMLYGNKDFFKEVLNKAIQETKEINYSWIYSIINHKRYINNYEIMPFNYKHGK